MLDEGYIKYQIEWKKGPAPASAHLGDLLACRNRLHSRRLIGYNAELGVGFGNISIRDGKTERFFISGTQTGHLFPLKADHCTQVTRADIPRNQLQCLGPLKASSESLTHAAVYAANPLIGAVIHVHHLEHWQRLLYQLPTTPTEIPYGTPEMAEAVKRLFVETSLAHKGFFVMGGHQEGMIAFGPDVLTAEEELLSVLAG